MQNIIDICQEKAALWRVARADLVVKIVSTLTMLLVWQSFGAALAMQFRVGFNFLLLQQEMPPLLDGAPSVSSQMFKHIFVTWWGWKTFLIPSLLLGTVWAIIEKQENQKGGIWQFALRMGAILALIFSLPTLKLNYVILMSANLSTPDFLFFVCTEWMKNGAFVGSLFLMGYGLVLRWRFLEKNEAKPMTEVVFKKAALNKFSQEVRRILSRAEANAWREGHNEVGFELLWLAALQEETLLPALAALNVPIEAMENQLQTAVEESGNNENSRENQTIQMTQQAKEVVARAYIIAQKEKQNPVAVLPRHLLVALILSEENNVRRAILLQNGVDVRALQNEIAN